MSGLLPLDPRGSPSLGEDRDHEGGTGAGQEDGEFPASDRRRESLPREVSGRVSDERRVHHMGILAASKEVPWEDS